MKEALYYKPEHGAGDAVRCLLCPQACLVLPLQYGDCRARRNVKGKLYSAVYGTVVSVNLDPVEKKPLYHFFPGGRILSCGTTGCNFRCPFCQNWEISQATAGEIPAETVTPQRLLALARQYGSFGIAYTYNEPLVNYEWVRETAMLFREQGLRNVLVSNGYINPEPWQELLPLIDAANIDVKSFREEFYRSQCGGSRAPVLRTIERMVQAGKHVEITTLLIPGMNDSAGELEKLVDWIAGLDRNIPLHFSRYFPQFHLGIPPTEPEALLRACERARKKLYYVYPGNMPAGDYDATRCPDCGAVLIERAGYRTKVAGLNGGTCVACGKKTNILQKEKADD